MEEAGTHMTTAAVKGGERPAAAYTICIGSTRLLPTVQLTLMNSHGHKIPARGLVDQATAMSFVSEHVAEALSFPRRNRNVRVRRRRLYYCSRKE